MGVADGWVEIGDRFFVRRYAFYDQNIGLILGDGEALVIDTRSTTRRRARSSSHVRELTRDPVTVVVDTHGHFDHAFGNRVFRPAIDLGPRAVRAVHGADRRARAGRHRADEPDLADDLREVVIDPPDRTFDRDGDSRGRRACGRAALPGSRPHRPRHRHHRSRSTRRAVGRRPPRRRRRPVLRRRLSARLAGDGGGPRGPRRARPASSCPATATTPVGRSPTRRQRRSPRWPRWPVASSPGSYRWTTPWLTRPRSRASRDEPSGARWNEPSSSCAANSSSPGGSGPARMPGRARRRMS